MTTAATVIAVGLYKAAAAATILHKQWGLSK